MGAVDWAYEVRPPQFVIVVFGRHRYRGRCPMSRCISVFISDWSTSTTTSTTTCEYHHQPCPTPMFRPSRIEPPAVAFLLVHLASPHELDYCCCCLLLARAELETGVPETGKGDRGAQERRGRHRACRAVAAALREAQLGKGTRFTLEMGTHDWLGNGLTILAWKWVHTRWLGKWLTIWHGNGCSILARKKVHDDLAWNWVHDLA